MLTIDGVDDSEEMKATDDAMDILGFTKVCHTIFYFISI
jgi:myosin heavy subunit